MLKMPKDYFDSVIISDTSCLIALTNIERLSLLRELCHTVIITPEVAGEYGEPLPKWIQIIPVRDSGRITIFR
jgi:predicted nucleic acid-binding protein